MQADRRPGRSKPGLRVGRGGRGIEGREEARC